jgi:hypothetical protein
MLKQQSTKFPKQNWRRWVGKRWDIKPLTFRSGACSSSKAPPLGWRITQAYLSANTPELCGEVSQLKIETQQLEQDVDFLGMGWEHLRWSGYLRQRLALMKCPEQCGVYEAPDIVEATRLWFWSHCGWMAHWLGDIQAYWVYRKRW